MTYIFQGITEKNKRKLLNNLYADTLHIKTGQGIFDMYKDEEIIGIIIKGNLKIISNTENGNEILIENLEENDIFSTTLSFSSASVSDVIAIEDSEVIIISLSYDEILKYKDNSKKYYNLFIKNLFIIFSQKLKERNERLQIISKKTIRNKLLEYFDIMYKKNLSRNIYLPGTYISFAAYLATDRSALSRELKNLKDEGFILINGKRITLLYK